MSGCVILANPDNGALL